MGLPAHVSLSIEKYGCTTDLWYYYRPCARIKKLFLWKRKCQWCVKICKHILPPIQNMLSCRIKEALSMMPYTFAKYKYGGRRFFCRLFRGQSRHRLCDVGGWWRGYSGHIIDSRQTLHMIKLWKLQNSYYLQSPKIEEELKWQVPFAV